MIFSFLSPIWKYLGEAFVPEFSLVLNILREGLDFVEAGRPFQSRNVQGMKLLLYETVLQKVISSWSDHGACSVPDYILRYHGPQSNE